MEVLQLSTEHEDGAAVVIRMSGELDVATTPAFRELVNELVSRGHNRLVLDLAGLEFIDSTGIGAFLGALNRAQQAHGSLCLRSVPARISSLLAMVGLDEVLTLEPPRTADRSSPELALS